jgi:hypothetical protein
MFCVDDNGYAVTGLLPPTAGLNCDMYIYYEQEDVNVEPVEEYDW